MDRIFLDPALRPALKVVREMQDKSPEERQRFAKNPQSFIKTALIEVGIEDESADQIVESSFVETDKFSDRVLEIGVWTPPVLPFVKNNPNTWLPEGFGLKNRDRKLHSLRRGRQTSRRTTGGSPDNKRDICPDTGN